MRLCDWFAGIDLTDRDVIAAIGSAQGGSPPRVHGSRSFAAESDIARDRAFREISEWLRLESGGSLHEVAFTIHGGGYQARPSSAECRFSEPAEVDEEMVEMVRQQALANAGLVGPVLCSTARIFVCDGRSFPEAPLGLTVRSLSIDLVNWIAEPGFVRSMTGLVDDVGLAPGLIVPRVVALAEATLTPAERDRGAVVLSVSDGLTEAVVYRNGQLDDLFVVPLGKARLDAKLASACGISIELVERIDLGRMFESTYADPIVQRVRTIVAAWSLSLVRAVRERLEATGPVWQLRSGIVIVDSARALPLLAGTATRVLGVATRIATAESVAMSATLGEPLAARGLIPLQWRYRAEAAESLGLARIAELGFDAVERKDRHGIGPLIGRWLREFVPADHAP